ncbi:hypothetical protein KW805_02815 [Candidatus Pacearchaeota archaeon]|nr:hypothetical protein [Candidatus Pacearchaeota archaeon]
MSFIVAMVGLLILVLIFVLSPFHEIRNKSQIDTLMENRKVSTQGKVVHERKFGNSYILVLDNNIEIITSDIFPVINETMSVEGKVDDYDGVKRIRALAMHIKN